MKPRSDDTSAVVREGVEKAAREFSERIAPLGFSRTKRLLWVRRHLHTADVIGLSRGFRPPLNYSVDLSIDFIRVLNDAFEGLALNAPNAPALVSAGRYHHRFNAKSGSTYERCIDDLSRFVSSECEPWFVRFREVEALLSFADSPLGQPEKHRLRDALTGNGETSAVERSLKLLGISTRRDRNTKPDEPDNDGFGPET
ncbi:MAG: hypothetical protein JST54_03895 [Deltaproteobacteria bacterium]|nr:hypothetical protein [Deltaproteobacteria bacterium]